MTTGLRDAFELVQALARRLRTATPHCVAARRAARRLHGWSMIAAHTNLLARAFTWGVPAAKARPGPAPLAAGPLERSPGARIRTIGGLATGVIEVQAMTVAARPARTGCRPAARPH